MRCHAHFPDRPFKMGKERTTLQMYSAMSAPSGEYCRHPGHLIPAVCRMPVGMQIIARSRRNAGLKSAMLSAGDDCTKSPALYKLNFEYRNPKMLQMESGSWIIGSSR